MNEAIMEKMGFEEEVQMVKEGKCPICVTVITAEMLDEMPLADKKEFRISGICSKCQAEIFG